MKEGWAYWVIIWQVIFGGYVLSFIKLPWSDWGKHCQKDLKNFSKYIEIAQMFLSGTKGSKWCVRIWKMTPGVESFSQADNVAGVRLSSVDCSNDRKFPWFEKGLRLEDYGIKFGKAESLFKNSAKTYEWWSEGASHLRTSSIILKLNQTFHWVISGNETWNSHYDPENKRWRSQWKCPA